MKYSFMVDAQRVMDLKRGLKWNKTNSATFSIALHQAHDMPDIRDSSFEVRAGFKTSVLVSSFQLHSDDAVKTIEVNKRNCKFAEENDGLSIFNRYSR